MFSPLQLSGQAEHPLFLPEPVLHAGHADSDTAVRVVHKTKLYNTYLGMVLIFQLIDLPLVVLIMLGLFRRYSGRARAIRPGRRAPSRYGSSGDHLPLVRPGLVATAFLCTIFSWNNYLQLYVDKRRSPEAVVRLTLYRSFTGMMWGPMSAAILLTVCRCSPGDRHPDVYRPRPDAGRGKGLAGGGANWRSVTFTNVWKIYNGGSSRQRPQPDGRGRSVPGLFGPSGCGKTTSLRMVAGLEEITSGEVALATGGQRPGPRQRDIAMVFESYGLYPHLTVYENIAFPLRCATSERPRSSSVSSGAAES